MRLKRYPTWNSATRRPTATKGYFHAKPVPLRLVVTVRLSASTAVFKVMKDYDSLGEAIYKRNDVMSNMMNGLSKLSKRKGKNASCEERYGTPPRRQFGRATAINPF